MSEIIASVLAAVAGAATTALLTIVHSGGWGILAFWRWQRMGLKCQSIRVLQATYEDGTPAIDFSPVEHQLERVTFLVRGRRVKAHAYIRMFLRETGEILTEGEFTAVGLVERGNVFVTYSVVDRKRLIKWAGIGHFRHSVGNEFRAFWLSRNAEERPILGTTILEVEGARAVQILDLGSSETN